ncbi:hypothetical protein ACI2LC_46150 [Nonomuraea wenchangensis]|uniref:hypothetical protein n=1 Tax=Nonomuraea wenchangensis TaxID=568860 RepID=UPI003404B3EB
MHGARIQSAGLPHLADDSRIVVGALVGAVAVNAAKGLMHIKRAIVAGERLSSLM